MKCGYAIIYMKNILLFHFFVIFSLFSEWYRDKGTAGPPQISKKKTFTTIVYRFSPLTIVSELSILDVCTGLGYAFTWEGGWRK